jgi:mRNA interferase MazF
MRRGDVVIVSAPGDFGKPRPAVVIQSDVFDQEEATVVLCLVTSSLQDTPLYRLTVEPTEQNGLKEKSQIMADKIFTFRRKRIRGPIGTIDGATMLELNRALILFLGLA